MKSIPEYFGCMVFNENCMKSRLPHETYKAMKKTIRDGKSLDISVANVVANAMKEALGCDGINLLQNNGPAAGQTVFHLHIHIIPRKSGDGIDAWPKFNGTKCEIEELFQKFKIR